MKISILVVVLAGLLCGGGFSRSPQLVCEEVSINCDFPQDHVIDGPGERRSSADDEFDLDESNFPVGRREATTGKKVELALGLIFLVGVLVLALWRRNRTDT